MMHHKWKLNNNNNNNNNNNSINGGYFKCLAISNEGDTRGLLLTASLLGLNSQRI